MFIFEYVIKFASGMYYTNDAGNEYTKDKDEAYKYTAQGAACKIKRMREAGFLGWNNATIERVS